VAVPFSRNILALRTRLRDLNLKSQFSNFDSFRDIHVHIYDFLKFAGCFWELKWAIGIDENNTFLSQYLFKHQNCRSHSFGRLVGVRMGVVLC